MGKHILVVQQYMTYTHTHIHLHDLDTHTTKRAATIPYKPTETNDHAITSVPLSNLSHTHKYTPSFLYNEGVNRFPENQNDTIPVMPHVFLLHRFLARYGSREQSGHCTIVPLYHCAIVSLLQ